MTTIQVQISDADVKKFNLRNNTEIKFSDLMDRIKTEHARLALKECNQIAADVGLNNLTLDEINAEINAVRSSKGNS